MILIISHTNDVHVDVVETALSAQGTNAFRLNVDEYPRITKISPLLLQHPRQFTVTTPFSALSTCEVDVVWYRRPMTIAPHDVADLDDRKFIESEVSEVLGSLYLSLSHASWINSIESIERSKRKLDQLMQAHSLGLSVPRTLLTSDPAEAFKFYDDCNGNIIYKTLHAHVRPSITPQRFAGIYTNMVTAQVLRAHGDQIRLVPCLFQEYVEKEIELRVTIMGQTTLAVSIDAQRSERARIDWRRYDTPNTKYAAYTLDSATESRLRNLIASYGLVFACIDLIVRPTGEIVFLEINPSGQWYWLEELTGLPFTKSMADMLSYNGKLSVRS